MKKKEIPKREIIEQKKNKCNKKNHKKILIN